MIEKKNSKLVVFRKMRAHFSLIFIFNDIDCFEVQISLSFHVVGADKNWTKCVFEVQRSLSFRVVGADKNWTKCVSTMNHRILPGSISKDKEAFHSVFNKYR